MTTRLKRRQGYTLIEVMMAVGVFTVGALGILSMHQAAQRANTDARELTTGLNILNIWQSRIQRDALLWTAASTAALDPTAFLDQTPATGTGGWFIPNPTLAADESYGFTYLGDDTRNLANIRYCVNLRMRWLIVNQAIRADIRVWWPKHLATGDTDYTLLNNCTLASSQAPITTDLAGATPKLRAVSTSLVVRWTSLQ